MRTWRDFVTLINGSWRKGAADFIACSRHLIARARDAFNVMVKSKLDFADSVARRLMHIASNETLCSHVNRLPPCWSTLYYVNQLSESALKAAFADGRIHPGLMRKDAIGLKPKKPVTKQTTTETSSVAAPAELNLDWWNGLPLVQRRAFLDLLGRDGLCAVMSTALKADIRDHVLGVIIAGASKSSAFAVDATNKFHVASLCPADKFPACSRYFRPPRPSIRTRWQNRRRSKRPRPKPLSASSRRRPGRSPVLRANETLSFTEIEK